MGSLAVINCCRMIRPLLFEPVSSEGFCQGVSGENERDEVLIRLSIVNDSAWLSPSDDTK